MESQTQLRQVSGETTKSYLRGTLDQGLQPDLEKVRAVRSMPVPGSKEDVRRFLGFVQYLSKFIPNMSTVDAPLRDVMKRNVDFYWHKQQQRSFDELKELCCNTPVLAYYDVTKDVTIQCDASSYRLGGVVLQDGRPIAYTSRALTPTEKRYAQLEKEMLAISPVPCVISFKFYGDLQNYKFLERLGPTEPEK